MKHIVHGIVVFVIFILFIVAVLTITGKDAKYNNQESVLSSVVDQTVEALLTETAYTINDIDEFQTALMFALARELQGETDFVVDVYGVDLEKGIVSINVKETHENPNGTLKTRECSRTVLLEKVTAENQTCTVRFFNRIIQEDGTYVEFLDSLLVMNCGDTLTLPSYGTWKTASGVDAVDGIAVTEDIDYFYTY